MHIIHCSGQILQSFHLLKDWFSEVLSHIQSSLWRVRFVPLTHTMYQKPGPHPHENTCSPISVNITPSGCLLLHSNTVLYGKLKSTSNKQTNKQVSLLVYTLNPCFHLFPFLGNSKCLCSIATLMCRAPKGFTNCRR